MDTQLPKIFMDYKSMKEAINSNDFLNNFTSVWYNGSPENFFQTNLMEFKTLNVFFIFSAENVLKPSLGASM